MRLLEWWLRRQRAQLVSIAKQLQDLKVIDFDTEIGYTERVTEQALRVFCLIHQNTLLSTKPTFGINSLALRDTKANAAEVGYFITKKSRVLPARKPTRPDHRRSLTVLNINRSLPDHNSLVNNLIGGAL